MNKNLIKWIGLAATILGTGATLVSGWVSEKKNEEKIEAEVKKAIARMK